MAPNNPAEDWELLSQISQAYRSLSDTLMDQIGMHRAQATLLCRLFAQDGMTQSEIADQLGVQGATVTNMLQRMEETGLVIRQRDNEDNRLVRVYLTDDGRTKELLIAEQFAKLETLIFEGFAATDRAKLRELLRRLYTNISRCQ